MSKYIQRLHNVMQHVSTNQLTMAIGGDKIMH